MVEGYKRLIKKGELVDNFQDFTWLLLLYSNAFNRGSFTMFLGIRRNPQRNICPNKDCSARDLGKGILNVLSCNR